MSTRIEPRSTSPLPMDVIPKTINNKLPNEILLSIFQQLGMKDCSSARLTCHHWKAIVDHPTTIYCQYKQEIDAVKKLPPIAPKCSNWELMPRHWELKEYGIRFSSFSSDIITFYPPFCCQSSMFFSFSSPISLSDRYVILAHYGNTYFLTEQARSPLLELPTDLQPLASYKLITKNFQDPSKDKVVSLLGGLAATPMNLSICQIEHCFPISESNVAVVTSKGEVLFWDLSKEPPFCYQTLQIEARSDVCKIGNYLVLNNKIIDLITQSAREHAFTFQNEEVKIWGSALCAYSKERGEIRYFSLNRSGLLNKQWDLNVDSLSKNLDSSKGPIKRLDVQEMNEQYIVLACWQSKTLNLLILSSNGEVIHTICNNGDMDWNFFAYLLGNILIICHDPQSQILNFWHIPTKRLIKSICLLQEEYKYNQNPYWGVGNIQDICFHEGKLTVLLSSVRSKLTRRFRIIQFDPQSISLTL
jgi:hypothetical protein